MKEQRLCDTQRITTTEGVIVNHIKRFRVGDEYEIRVSHVEITPNNPVPDIDCGTDCLLQEQLDQFKRQLQWKIKPGTNQSGRGYCGGCESNAGYVIQAVKK